MFRILEIGLDGIVTVHDDVSRIGLPPEGVFRWVDLSAQDEPQLDVLRLGFNFHPLAIEDCAHFDQRPKMEEYENYLFIVTQGFVCEGGSVGNLKVQELHTFIGRQFLVTIHSEGIEALDSVWKRGTTDVNLMTRGADFVFYLIADRMVDGNFPILDLAAEELESLEEEVLSNLSTSPEPDHRSVLHALSVGPWKNSSPV